MDISWDLISESLVITGFVFVMMLVVEYLSVLTRGRAEHVVASRGATQKLSAALLGVSPGCLGAYVVSSLFIHRVISFGALTAAMLATCGDEAFLLLALAPGKALLLFGTLFVVGVSTGFIVDMVFPHPTEQPSAARHGAEGHPVTTQCVPISHHQLLQQWRRCSAHRGWLTLLLALFVAGVATGKLGHQHAFMHQLEPAAERDQSTAHHDDSGGLHDQHIHDDADVTNQADPGLKGGEAEEHHEAEHEAGHDHASHAAEWNWVRVTLLLVGLIGLGIVATVPDHFLDEHLWNHLVRVHVWKIFLWITGAVVVTHLLVSKIDIAAAVSAHHLPLLLVALAVGLIPVSGPHLIFVTLYAQGAIPFSALLANSIVQDGHGMLPVLAHDRRTFVVMRLIKLAIGLALGLALQAFGF